VSNEEENEMEIVHEVKRIFHFPFVILDFSLDASHPRQAFRNSLSVEPLNIRVT
jgi:hypothetical protein